MNKHHSTDYKENAIKYYLKCKNYVETCEYYNCNRTSLMRWVKRFLENGTVENKARTTESYKITKDQLKYAISQLSKNKMITMDELIKKIKLKYNDFDISPQWLGKVLRDNFISRKRTKRKHFPETRYGKPISYEEEVKKLFHKINKYNLNAIISIDETSIRPNMIPEYCRSEKGKRCYYKSSDNRVSHTQKLHKSAKTKP